MKKKLRRVTNTASVYKGHSLNTAFSTGPDLLCSLVGLLLRFQQYKIAVTGDIEAMSMQVAIRSEDQDALRFLWNKDGEEKIFKYKRLIFGATCSPPCAIHILHRCAKENKLSNLEAYSAIKKNLYMDDYLQSFKTTDTAAITTTENIFLPRQAQPHELEKLYTILFHPNCYQIKHISGRVSYL